MKNRSSSVGYVQKSRLGLRAGFTLVEMLVAVGLIVLLMLLFVEIFSVATGTMSQQRAVAHNNQRARTFMTLIKSDLEKRTFRNVVPFFAGETQANSPVSFGNRAGYFYISENDPNNDTDNVLQFSVRSTIEIESEDNEPFVGKSINLGPSLFNQPDADNGRSEDNLSSSSAAEVVYFLRGRNLYRRVQLIRDPLIGDEPNPTDNQGNRLFNSSGQALAILNNLDCSVFDSQFNDPDVGVVEFNSVLDLNNTQPDSMGLPRRRFGFFGEAYGVPGRPMEHLQTGEFFGRFTQEETSHISENTAFNYPHHLTEANPLTANNLALNPVDNSVSPFSGGQRKGEDLLLTNVLAFIVEVWDGDAERGEFTRLGQGGSPFGYFNAGNRSNIWFGDEPNGLNYAFDTWHPEASIQDPQDPQGNPVTSAPFRMLKQGLNINEWQSNQDYMIGDLVFPRNAASLGYSTRFRCIHSGPPRQSDNTGRSGNNEPGWIYRDGEEIPDGSVIWRAETHVLPLRAIRITIRFMHPTSDQPRQVTIVHSLID